MNIKEKWYAQIEILEKFKKKLEKRLKEYEIELNSGNFVSQGQFEIVIELEEIISELEDEIAVIMQQGIREE
jgi:sugar-specific transcriptional regulator TrmB